jgi:recombination endonuclease VII
MEIISKEEAKARGLKRYYTGVPCANGHDSERYLNKGNEGKCVQCCNKRKRRLDNLHRQKSAYKEKQSARFKRWYSENKEKQFSNVLKWRESNPDKVRAYTEKHCRKRLGLTPEEQEFIFDYQGKKCALCSSTDPKCSAGWHLDHSHDIEERVGTRQSIRGFLCQPCNTLGLAGYEYLNKAVAVSHNPIIDAYMQAPPAQQALALIDNIISEE